MATIVTREVGASNVGRPLTNTELDNNFINLNTAIANVLPSQTSNSGLFLTTNGSAASWSTIPFPTTTTYLASSVSLTNGVYISGTVSSIQTYGDYAAGNYYNFTDGTGTGPAWILTVGFTNIVKFNRAVLNIQYTVNSGHTIYVDLYNYTSSSWDSIGSYTGLNGYYQFALEVLSSTPYISGGATQLRLYHSNGGNASHETRVDYVALENSVQGAQGPRGATGATGATGPAGSGVPTGGTANQILVKNSSTDYDVSFANINTGYLSDVTITSVANNQILQYDSTTSKWKNVTSPYAPLASPNFTGTVSGVTKAMVGLGNVENTAISTWTGSTNITSLGTVTVGSAPASDVFSWAKQPSKPSYTASEVGLGNVTNESKATMFANSTFTGTTTIATASMTNGSVSTAPSSNNDLVNKVYSDSGTQTLSNKRIQARVNVAASATTYAVNADNYDATEMVMTGAAGTVLISAPTGTPLNGQKLIYKLQCTYAQTLSWASIFQGSTDLSLPSITSGNSKWDFYGFIYNSTPAKWQLVAKMAGF
jgi:hypothetical protein